MMFRVPPTLTAISFGIIGIHSDHGSAVNDHGTAALGHIEERVQRADIGQIAQDNVHIFGDVLNGRIIGQDQSPDLTAGFQQLHTDIGAQETGGTGKQIIAIVLHIIHLNLS